MSANTDLKIKLYLGPAELSLGLDSNYHIFQSEKNHWKEFLKLKEITSCVTGGGQKHLNMFHRNAPPLQTLNQRGDACSNICQLPFIM